jgi:hypothetical protein
VTAISVLLPSRGRPASLAKTVMILDKLADDPAGVEILVAADPDDKPTHLVPLRSPSLLWTAPERYGYCRIHEYVNHLAAAATGEWLLLWNDDAIMLTKGWDMIIRQSPQAVLWSHANHATHCNLFPAWPRAWTDAMGHVALCWNCDTWMQVIGEQVGRHMPIPVEVLHDRADETGNHDDLTAAEGYRVSDKENNIFLRADLRAQRETDAMVVRAVLAQQGSLESVR